MPHAIKNHRGYKLLTLLLFLLPAFIFYGVMTAHLVNLPRDDDLFSIVPFLNQWDDANSVGERISLIFSQYYSHRIVLTKSISALLFEMAGYCNFIWMQTLGWCAWAGITFLVLRNSEQVLKHLWLGLPVMLILMQPQGSTNFLIAMQAIQNLGVVFFAFASIHFALKPGTSALTFGLPLAILAPLTSVNGLLAFPVIVVGLMMKKDYRNALIYACAGGLTGAFFLLHYDNPASSFHFIEFLHNAAVMAGAPLLFGTLGLAFATTCGSMLLVAAVITIALKARQRLLTALPLMLLFVLLSIAMTALGRIGWGPSYMDQDRYRLYGLLILILLYLIWLPSLRIGRLRIVIWPAILCSAGFGLLSYATYLPQVTTNLRMTKALSLNRQIDREYASTTPELWDEALVNIQAAIERGVIRLPKLLSDADLEVLAQLHLKKEQEPPLFHSQASSAYCGYLLTPNAKQDYPTPPEFVVTLLQDRPFILPVTVSRSTLREVPSRWSFYSSRFAVILPEKLQERGIHPVVGLNRDLNGQLTRIWSGQYESEKNSEIE